MLCDSPVALLKPPSICGFRLSCGPWPGCGHWHLARLPSQAILGPPQLSQAAGPALAREIKCEEVLVTGLGTEKPTRPSVSFFLYGGRLVDAWTLASGSVL